jgi:hypothetical protein
MNLHFLFLVCGLLASESGATSFYIRPLPDFTRDAENIIRGRLHQPHAEFGIAQSGERNVYTFAELEVMEVLKGTITKPSLPIRKLGGTKDGITLNIPGSPEFQDGEESVFFLGTENEDHSYELTGLELGKFSLQEKNGELELSGGLLGYSSGPEAMDAMGPGVVENRRIWTLKQLKELIAIQKNEAPAIKTSDSAAGSSTTSTGPGTAPKEPAAESGAAAQSATSEPKPAESGESGTVPANFAGLLFLVGGAFLGIFLYLRRK